MMERQKIQKQIDDYQDELDNLNEEIENEKNNINDKKICIQAANRIDLGENITEDTCDKECKNLGISGCNAFSYNLAYNQCYLFQNCNKVEENPDYITIWMDKSKNEETEEVIEETSNNKIFIIIGVALLIFFIFFKN